MQFVIPGCKVDPPLRATGQMVHLTYAALYDGELTFDSMLNAARSWGAAYHGLREYMIGRETHPAPADPQRPEHFHAYFKFGKRVDVRDRHHTTVFDLQGQNGRVLHPELQSVLPTPGDRERVINYDMKDGDYVSELETALVNDPRRDAAEAEARDAASDAEEAVEQDVEKDKVPGWARMLNKANSTSEGMALLAEKAPHIFYLNGSRIKPMLAERVGTPEPKLFSLADFNRPPLNLDAPVVLHGDTNCCKTEFALAHFESPLVVRRRDDLKRFRGATDGIVFDDVDFRDWTPEDTIGLLSMDKPRSLPARFHDAFIEADIPMIFITNKKPKKMFVRAESSKQRAAIKRRYESVEVTSSLARLGRPMTPAEKRVRREAGRNGPQGPGVN